MCKTTLKRISSNGAREITRRASLQDAIAVGLFAGRAEFEPEILFCIAKTNISDHRPAEIFTFRQLAALDFISQQIAEHSAEIFVPRIREK